MRYPAAVPDRPEPIQRVLDVAARKGVKLEIRTFDESTHTAEEAAGAVGAELGQIVKSLVFAAPPAPMAPSNPSCVSCRDRTASTWRDSPS